MFVGRSYQLELLSSLWAKDAASLVAVSGRRRIGKSTLVETFAEHSRCRFIEIEGLPPDETMTNARQLANFCGRLSKATGRKVPMASTWPEAFDALAESVTGRGKTIVFLDEISWMGGYDEGFAGFLKSAWDTQLSRRNRLVLVVAGSVSAWIRKNILNSKGFVGRVSLDISLPELSLAESRAFWGRRAERVSQREMLDMLSVTGGVPKYLQEMNPALSTEENIRRMCFSPEGYLFKDFDRIFSDVFGVGMAAKRRILEALAEGSASVSDLAKRLGVVPNGHISEDITDLIEAGFVAAGTGKNPITGADVREVRYRLRDNYTRFYLKFILPRQEAIRNGLHRFVDLESMPGWDAILGLQFENLVINNLSVLCERIGLGRKLVTSAAPYVRRKTVSCPGVQVDLLIQTPKSIYVVEVKRQRRLGVEIEQELVEKVKRLSIPRDHSVRTVLVYDGQLAPEVEENGYIDFIVSAAELLG